MSQITGKGKAWELRNSLWMLWAIVTFGFLNYVSFYYVSYKVKQRKWFILGIIYSIVFILFIVVSDLYPIDHWLYNVTFIAYFIGWVISIIQVFKIRAEYLLRLEARNSSMQKEIESLKLKISQEYGTSTSITKSTKEQTKMIQEEEGNKIKASSLEVQIIDINNASEQEIASIPGIGGILAKKVVSARSQENGFTSIDHFVEVLAVKPHVIEKIKPYLKFPNTNSTETKKSEGRIVDF